MKRQASAILNEISEKHPNICLSIEGRICEKFCLSNIDICTIFSNLFDNAFEAAEKSEGKAVYIEFKYVGSSFLCTIKNIVAHKMEIINNKICTEKEDKINHGHGIDNVASCTKRNSGSITLSCTEEFFYADLMFQIYENDVEAF